MIDDTRAECRAPAWATDAVVSVALSLNGFTVLPSSVFDCAALKLHYYDYDAVRASLRRTPSAGPTSGGTSIDITANISFPSTANARHATARNGSQRHVMVCSGMQPNATLLLSIVS